MRRSRQSSQGSAHLLQQGGRAARLRAQRKPEAIVRGRAHVHPPAAQRRAATNQRKASARRAPAPAGTESGRRFSARSALVPRSWLALLAGAVRDRAPRQALARPGVEAETPISRGRRPRLLGGLATSRRRAA